MNNESLGWLAETVCSVLAKSVNAQYAQDKRERLAGLNRFRVLAWINELDDNNLNALADRLDISAVDLDITRKTVRYL